MTTDMSSQDGIRTRTELSRQAFLPTARGPVSAALIDALRGTGPLAVPSNAIAQSDPLGDDVQLALHVCYELHYQGFEGVPDSWEWNPELIAVRSDLEQLFLGALRSGTAGGADLENEFDDLLTEHADAAGVSHYLRDTGTWQQMREFFVHRSIYHLKEADPHAWAIPRLRGHAKAAFVAVEFDEFGGGRGDRMHSRLFANLLDAADLDSSYLGYLDQVPSHGIATVNLMSMFGLHRGLRGALVGHFAAAEITTAPSAQRMDQALRRLGADEPCRHFYTEHIEADAVHEQVLRNDVVGSLLVHEPDLVGDVMFGIQATSLLEERLSNHLLDSWKKDRTSLRWELPRPTGPGDEPVGGKQRNQFADS